MNNGQYRLFGPSIIMIFRFSNSGVKREKKQNWPRLPSIIKFFRCNGSVVKISKVLKNLTGKAQDGPDVEI